jgi:colicin import membrane protein
MPIKPQENLIMKKTFSSLTIAALALFGAQAVMAQTATAPAPTREQVKKETAAANKAGAIPGTGTSKVPDDAAGQKSPKQAAATTDTTRDARKDSTAAANKAGAIPDTKGGAGVTQAGDKAVKDSKSTEPRADVKKETAAANKAGTIPQTEAQMQAPKK